MERIERERDWVGREARERGPRGGVGGRQTLGIYPRRSRVEREDTEGRLFGVEGWQGARSTRREGREGEEGRREAGQGERGGGAMSGRIAAMGRAIAARARSVRTYIGRRRGSQSEDA